MAKRTREIVVYCVSDDNIGPRTLKNRILECVTTWPESKEVFGKITSIEHRVEASEPVSLYPPLEKDGMYDKPRSRKAKKSPAPFNVSKHILTVEYNSEYESITIGMVVGKNIFKSYDMDIYLDASESAQMDGVPTKERCTVKQLASGSDGPEGLIGDVLYQAACHPSSVYADEGTSHEFEDKKIFMSVGYGIPD